jgi:hypothetical protein
MRKKVMLADVMNWLLAAFEAATEDPGDAGDTTTALRYRELRVDFAVHSGGASSVFVRTRNDGFSGSGWHTYRNITGDGAVVLWEREMGVPTGEDWLPQGFIDWMREA